MRILVIGGTQFMGRETVERLVARGHDDAFLSKPFNARELLAAVRRLMNPDADEAR
jgi:nucleoside-diphosphate-sugar epimerase